MTDSEQAELARQTGTPTGQISDGYHTFDELYEHRVTLWIALCRRVAGSVRESLNPTWRTKLHSDGTAFEGWFVLGIFFEAGHQITYHLPDSRWDQCYFAREIKQASEFEECRCPEKD